MNITEVLVPAQESAWLPWAVQYFFYIGSAYAASILFLFAVIFKNNVSHTLRSALALTMAIGGIVGPLALTADLHQPGRAWHFFVHLTPWSWMSNGSLFLPLFSMLTVLSAWLYLRADLAKLQASGNKIVRLIGLLTLGKWQVSNKVMVAIAGLTAISGLSIALYTGMEISVVESRPLWHQPASPLIWFSTAFIGAIGFTLLIICLMPKASATPEVDIKEANQMQTSEQSVIFGDKRFISRTLGLSGVASFILLPLWASNSSVSLLSIPGWTVSLGGLMLGFTLCLVISFVMKKCANRPNRIGLLIISALTLSTCWVLRWVTLMDVQTLPKYDVGPYPYQLPLDTSGLVGIIGMFGLWLVIAAITSELFAPIQSTTVSNTHTEEGLNHG